MKNGTLAILLWAQYLSLAVWIGMLASIAVFAPVTFKELAPDRFTAGQIVGGTIRIMGMINLAACCILLLSIAVLAVIHKSFCSPVRLRSIVTMKIILPLIMGVITCYLLFKVGPRMDELRNTVSETTYSEWSGKEKNEFDDLHTFYTRASQTILFGGVFVFFLIGYEQALFSSFTKISAPVNVEEQE